jgi:hypothetical protein
MRFMARKIPAVAGFLVFSAASRFLRGFRTAEANKALLCAVCLQMFLCGVLRVLGGMKMVRVRRVCMVGGFLMAASFVMLGGFVVMVCSLLMMFGCQLVMVGCFLGHVKLPFEKRLLEDPVLVPRMA